MCVCVGLSYRQPKYGRPGSVCSHPHDTYICNEHDVEPFARKNTAVSGPVPRTCTRAAAARALPLDVDVNPRPEHAAICSARGVRGARGSPLRVVARHDDHGRRDRLAHRPATESGSRSSGATTATRRPPRLLWRVRRLRPRPSECLLWSYVGLASRRHPKRGASARLRARA